MGKYGLMGENVGLLEPHGIVGDKRNYGRDENGERKWEL